MKKAFASLLVGLVAGVFATSALAGANTNLPFGDNFEAYTNGTPLIDGTNGWYGSSSSIIVSSNLDVVPVGSTNIAVIPVDCTLSNRFADIPPTNVFIQMAMRPSLYDGTNPPVVDTNAAVMFYVNTNGNYVVHNGPATNITNSANWVTVTNYPVGTNGTNWVTVGIYEDFTSANWDLYTKTNTDFSGDWVLVTNSIGFINTGLTNFAGFDVYNGATTSYLDNVGVAAFQPNMLFSTQPSPKTAYGAEFAQQPVVTILDVNGTTATWATNTVTLTLSSGAGTLNGTVSMPAVNGVATFTNLSIDTLGTNKQLTATVAGKNSATSSVFTIVGAASKLTFTTQPSPSSLSGAIFAQQPAVSIQDANGVTVESATDLITVTLTSGGGTLNGTTYADPVAGVATFTNLSITGVGTGKVLTAQVGGLTDGTTTPFIITDPAYMIRIETAPDGNGTVVGDTIVPSGSSLTVYAITRDSNTQFVGNVAADSWSLVFKTNVVDGDLVAAGNMKSATFTGGEPGTAAIEVQKSGLTIGVADSGIMTVTIGAANKTVFTTEPSASTVAGVAFAQQPVVAIRDVNGHTITTATDTVTLTLTGGNGTLGGTVSKSAVNGVADFAGLGVNIDKTGTNKVLTATVSGLTNNGTSSALTITPAAANRVGFATQPSASTVAGVAFAQQPVVEIQDAFSNLVTTAASNVVLTLTTGSGSLGGTANMDAVNGVADFVGKGLNIDLTGANKVLTATVTGLTPATTLPFAITAAAASKMAITQEPVGGASGALLATQPLLVIQDSFGNQVNTNTAVTVAIFSGAGGTLGGTTNVLASAGVVTYNNLTLAGTTGTPYVLIFSGVGVGTTNSAAITVTAGAASKLVITQQPVGAASDTALATQPLLVIQDAQGNQVNTNKTITASIFSGAGGTLGGTTNVAASAGIVSYTDLTLAGTVGTPYVLAFNGSGLTGTNSAAVNVSAGTASKLAFTTQPSPISVVNVAFAQQPVVTIQDAQGNTVTNGAYSTTNVSVALTTGDGVLTGSTNATAVGGVASFSGLKIDLPGTNKVLTATSPGLTSATTAPAFAITEGILLFQTQPSASTVAGVAFAQQPIVIVADASSNVIGTATNSITLTLSTGAGTLGGTVTMSAVAGVADFTGKGLNIDKTGTNKVLTASAAGLTSGNTTPAFTITAAAATRAVFSTQPSASTVAGVAFAQQPVVTIWDAFSNTVPVTTNVGLALTTGAGTLSGTTNMNTTSGVATFAGLNIDKVGADKVLTATVTSLTGDTTTPAFAITPAAATKAVFTTQPSASTVAGVAFAQQPVVTIWDAFSNTVPVTTNVGLTLTTGAGTLSGTTNMNTTAGVATFAGLSIDKVGADKVLTATVTGITPATTTPAFAITANAAARAVFTTQPSPSTVAGVAFAQQPVVTIWDAYSNTVPVTTNVGLTLTTGAGTLSGTTNMNTSSGVATFAGLSIDKVGADKVLTATVTGITPASTTPAFAITANAAARSVFTTQPSPSTVAGVAFAQQPVVTIWDAYSNTVPVTTNVGLTLTTGAGTLSGTTNMNTTAGVATFAGLSIDKIGADKVLTATATGITPATTTPAFAITAAGANKAVFTTQPSTSTVAGVIFAQQPVVTIWDAFSNTVTTASNAVGLTLTTGSGVLSGVTNMNAVAGVATFTNLSINLVGTNKVLTATSADAAGTDVTAAFTIVPAAASQIAFTTQPSASTVAGVAFAQQPVVTIQDAFGNTVINGADSVTNVAVALTTGLGVLSGTTNVVAVAGVATFSGLSIDLVGTNKVLTANATLTAGAVTTNTAPAFAITPAAGSKIAFTTQPSASTVAGAAFAQQPVVAIQDAFGNTVTSGADSTTNVALTLTTGTGALSGTASIPAVAGVASFSGLSINLVGNDKVLTATATLAAGVRTTNTSPAFAITVGAAAKLAISTQPVGGASGSALATQPVLSIQDASGNIVTGDSSTVVSVAIFSGAGGTLAGTTNKTAAAGIVTYTDLALTGTVGVNYVLRFTSGSLTSTDSVNVVVSKAPATVTLNNLNQTYNGSARIVTATTVPSGKTVDITYDGSATPPVNAGLYAIIGTINDAQYQGTTNGTLTVAKANQTISFPVIPDQIVTSSVSLAATASSGLGVTFVVVSGPAQILTGNTLTFTGTGAVSVGAAQLGDGNWNSATPVVNTFNVQPVFVPIVPINDADFDGDRKFDPSIYDARTGTWTVKLSTAGYATFTFAAFLGGPGYMAAVGDYDGDRISDPSVYKDTTGDWLVMQSSRGYARLDLMALLGAPGWVPCSANYVGTTHMELGVYQESTANWTVKLGTSVGSVEVYLYNFLGGPGWSAFGADFDGDGYADPTVYERATGTWKVMLSGANYFLLTLPNFLGGPGWTAVGGDYDGDRLADPIVRKDDGSVWKVMLSGSGYSTITLPLGL